MNVVELRGVSKCFEPPPEPWRRLFGLPPRDPVVALRDVSLGIQAGGVFGLVGPNGAGKTVLMKLLATLSEPTNGSVSLFGKDSRDAKQTVRGRIGMATTDERSFYWRLTCRQNMEFFARLHGLRRPDARRKIDELFDLLDVAALADRAYRVLSAGNRQRLAIVRALLADPDLLLLDEPTSSMDPMAAKNLRHLISERLHDDRRRTVIYTTHNLAEVEQLCSRVAVLHQGRLLACAPLEDLLQAAGPPETVTLTVRGELDQPVLDRLRSRVPGMTCSGLNGDNRRLSFLRKPDDTALDGVVGDLVRSGASILGCETRRRSFEEVFGQMIDQETESDRDA